MISIIAVISSKIGSILYKDFIHHTNFMVIENESELQKYSLRQKKIIM